MPSLETTPPTAMRRGLSGWWLMLIWELQSMRQLIPLILIVQLMMAVGIIFGLGLFLGSISAERQLYLVTGAVTMAMLLVGLVAAPQLIIFRRMQNLYDFLWTLPVPRLAGALATLSAGALTSLPGAMLALLFGTLIYDLPVAFSPAFIPAAILTVLAAGSIGFAMAHGIRNPQIVQLLTQVLFFVIMLFSPLSYPASNLPHVLQVVHRWLPFQHCADLIRGTLIGADAGGLWQSWLVLGAWSCAAWVVAWVVLRRRG